MRNLATKSGKLLLLAAVSVFAFSCYTMKTNPPKRVPQSEYANKVLHRAIFDYVEESLYTYPHIATRMGMHIRKLQSAEVIRLDRELPNYSEELVTARLDTLKEIKERLNEKVPLEVLSLNDQADRKLFVNAIDLEIINMGEKKVFAKDPMVHVGALAEAMYYPLVLEYAPEKERLADILGRMHWIPSFVDRAVRLLESSTEVHRAAAIEVNAWTIDLIENEIATKMEKHEDLQKSFSGMRSPVIDSLKRLQSFLENDLKKKSNKTWRLGEEQYSQQFSLAFHKITTPESVESDAEKRIVAIRKEIFKLAKPAYCEAKETDRKTCGPTKAELAAAARADEKKAKEEERKERIAAEKQKKEEEKKAAAEKKKAEAEEKKAEAEKKKKSEEKYDNPYESKPKKKEKEKKKVDGLSNPYSMLDAPVSLVMGAKLADDVEADEESEEKDTQVAEDEANKETDQDQEEESDTSDDPADAKSIDKVIAWAIQVVDAPKPATRPISNLERQIGYTASQATENKILSSSGVKGLEVKAMPAFLRATGHVFYLNPQPVFQPDQGARLFVASEGSTAPLADLSKSRMFFASARYGSPGEFELSKRTVEIEKQTRRAVRVLHADASFVEGWALYVATRLGSKMEDDDRPWEYKVVALTEELRAAVELLVDVRMHSAGMQESAAISLLKESGQMSSKRAENVVLRVKLDPTALAAPYIGLHGFKKTFRKLRKEGKTKLKSRKFNDKILEFGPIPVSMLYEFFKTDPDEVPDTGEVLEDVEEEKTITIIDAITQNK